MTSNPKSGPGGKAAGLWVIVLIKAGKGVLFLLLAVGLLAMAGKDLGDQFDSVIKSIGLNPEQKFISRIGDWLDTIKPSSVRGVGWTTVVYGLFCIVEGIGLAFRARWAGWMAIGESAFFIPIELLELRLHFSLLLLGVLVINIFIVWYLVRNRVRLFGARQH